MFWGKRRRGRKQISGGRQALMPIPLTGGLLSGEVRDDQGKPMADAEVSVFDRAGKRVARSDTDAYGFFAAAVVPGFYRVQAEAGGYRSHHERTQVEWGTHTTLPSLTLVPDETLTAPATGLYEIDPDHSAIRFSARHLGLSQVHGQFQEFGGQIRVAEPFEQSQVEVLIETASIFTNAEQRDEHLRSAEFLDVDRFPKMEFTSHRFTRIGGNRWLVDGHLTLHGMMSDVQLDAVYHGTQEWYGVRAGCTATAELQREHFSLNWQKMLARGVPAIGSTIQIQLDIQGVLQS